MDWINKWMDSLHIYYSSISSSSSSPSFLHINLDWPSQCYKLKFKHKALKQKLVIFCPFISFNFHMLLLDVLANACWINQFFIACSFAFAAGYSNHETDGFFSCSRQASWFIIFELFFYWHFHNHEWFVACIQKLFFLSGSDRQTWRISLSCLVWTGKEFPY